MALLRSRRWLRYSLRTMFVFLTGLCLWFGWQVRIVGQRRAARAEIRTAGGIIVSQRDVGIEPERPLPIWRRWMGDEEIGTIFWPDSRSLDAARVAEIERLFPEEHNSAALSTGDFMPTRALPRADD